MAKARIYLSLQEIEGGKVQFRKWSPDCPRNLPGGPFEPQSLDAHLWIQRMVFRCARAGYTPIVKWQEPISVTDDFLRLIPPFAVVEMPDTEEMEFLGHAREAGFDEARFVGGYQ